MYFAVEYIIHKWIDEDEVGYEVFEYNHIDSSTGDISEEFSEYMPISKQAKQQLEQYYSGVYKVFMAGVLTYYQDYDGEGDCDVNIIIGDTCLLNSSVDDYISANPETFITFD